MSSICAEIVPHEAPVERDLGIWIQQTVGITLEDIIDASDNDDTVNSNRPGNKTQCIATSPPGPVCSQRRSCFRRVTPTIDPSCDDLNIVANINMIKINTSLRTCPEPASRPSSPTKRRRARGPELQHSLPPTHTTTSSVAIARMHKTSSVVV
ncbi:hypothetical protein CLAFUW4_08940 [Fulvia fulva]|nr:hypothetical protein CLAFUR4_08946 [Fulvia fulva]KAK4614584.1 hypothetical protein CLAFUR0_08938 [Fulvia fulva]WPV20749.1 hypothetical protein CLAFUW4_08940 [Fulvia fulva]WPV35703.1 hypothetical protein CLAFUW7_08941 [Fulvia fulva]